MPRNTGRKPPYDFCDVKLRNGLVVRGIKTDGWRWKEWPEGPHAFDIVQYQPVRK